jgi:3-hydroxyethyl bacteriochlorophyllide a dehydrogenase
MIDAYAVVFPAANEAEIQTIGLPDPEPEDVVVETEFSGISIGTEGWIFTAAYYQTKFPLVTGYQKVGRITAMGDAVKDYAVGDRVFLRSTKIASGPPSMWGGHTSRSVANFRELIPVPAGTDPACASLLVLVAVGYHGAAELVDVQPGDLTVIIGQGLIGQFAAQVCKQRGCTVVTCEPLAKRRELSAALGADYAIDPTVQDPWEVISSIKPEGADVIIDCSANARAVNQSFNWLKNRGSKYCYQAYYPDETPIDMLWPHVKEMVAYHPTNVTEEGMREMMLWLADGRAKVEPLITQNWNWQRAPELFHMMMDNPLDCLGPVLDWTDAHPK